MPSHILPISIPPSHSSLGHPAPSAMPSAASTSTMLVKAGDDDPTACLQFSSSFEDDKAISIIPLLPRTLSYSTTTTSSSCYQQRRRRIASENSLSSLSTASTRRQSFGRDVGHAAAETFLVTRLSLKLLRYLG